MPQDQILKVWGELACFTRPELKVERFSYPVLTPSAVRGIYDAIYCKPTEFYWQVTMIELLTHPRYIALRRNEVKEKIPTPTTVLRWASGKKKPEPIFADDTSKDADKRGKGRTQRQTMALKNVCYRLHAYVHPWSGYENRLPAFEAQFRRRASQGKCVYQPYLGCREFPAYFELIEPDTSQEAPLDISMEVGLMLYDVFDLSRPGEPLDTGNDYLPSISLFQAEIENGVMKVPDYESEAVLKERRSGYA